MFLEGPYYDENVPLDQIDPTECRIVPGKVFSAQELVQGSRGLSIIFASKPSIARFIPLVDQFPPENRSGLLWGLAEQASSEAAADFLIAVAGTQQRFPQIRTSILQLVSSNASCAS